MLLIDTSVAVDHLRGVQLATQLLVGAVEQGDDVAASEIVRFELLSGVRDHEMASLDDFCQSITWVPVDREIATVAGRLARRFRRSHTGIDSADYLIAATALVLDVGLQTLNVKHFPMFNGLTAAY